MRLIMNSTTVAEMNGEEVQELAKIVQFAVDKGYGGEDGANVPFTDQLNVDLQKLSNIYTAMKEASDQ